MQLNYCTSIVNYLDLIREVELFFPFQSIIMYSIATYAATAGLLIGVYYIVIRRKPTSSSLPLPPGPKPLPIIGNLHQAPKAYGWRTYREWSKQYGPIVHVNMLGQPVIILSTSEVAHDLLAKRGAIFSD